MWNWLKRHSWLLAIGLIAVSMLHSVKPRLFSLDWQSVALILVGVLLLLIPPSQWGDLFQSVEVGNVKLLLRETRDLTLTVAAAKTEALGSSASKAEVAPPASAPPVGTVSEYISSVKPKSDSSSRADIDALLSVDTRMALIRIGIEIEQRLAALSRAAGLRVPERGINWSRTVGDLLNLGKISPITAKAIIDFRNVRNQIVHPTGSGDVPDALWVSALDSGLTLLNILDNVPANQ